MILEIIRDLVLCLGLTVKPCAQPYVAGIPSNLAVKPVPGGVNTRCRYELVPQVEGPEGCMAEGLAAEVEHPL